MADQAVTTAAEDMDTYAPGIPAAAAAVKQEMRDDNFDFLNAATTPPPPPMDEGMTSAVTPVFPLAQPNKVDVIPGHRTGVKRKKKKHKSNDWRKQLNEKVAQVLMQFQSFRQGFSQHLSFNS